MEKQAIDFKNSLYDVLAKLSKGLASDNRLEILNLLTQAPKTVETIARETGMSVANTSRHLQVLKNSHLVKTTRDGNHIVYRLSSVKVNTLIRLLIDVGEEEFPIMGQIQRQADKQVPVISLIDAYKERANSVFLDVRSRDEYTVKHIPGAVNIPYSELDRHLEQLPKNQRIIVYCRGRLCANSNLAAQKLHQNGFRAYSLNSSIQDWQEKLDA